jgi:hypothetical protein
MTYVVTATNCYHVQLDDNGIEISEFLNLAVDNHLIGGDNFQVSAFKPVWQRKGYCHTLLVTHAHREQMASFLGKYPTLSTVSSYIMDNNLPQNSRPLQYKTDGNFLHIYESTSGKVSLFTLNKILHPDCRIGGIQLLGTVTLFEPDERLVKTGELIVALVVGILLDWSIYHWSLLNIAVNSLLFSLFLTILVVVTHIWIFLLFALETTFIISKLLYTFRYSETPDVLALSGIDEVRESGDAFTGVQNDYSKGSLEPSTGYLRIRDISVPHPERLTPTANSELPCYSNQQRDTGFTDDNDPPTTILQVNFADDTGIPRNVSHNGKKAKGTRNRKGSLNRAVCDERPLQGLDDGNPGLPPNPQTFDR